MSTIANKIGFKAASLNAANCMPIKSKKTAAKPVAAKQLAGKPKANKLNKTA